MARSILRVAGWVMFPFGSLPLPLHYKEHPLSITFLFPQKYENTKLNVLNTHSVTLSMWCDRSCYFFFSPFLPQRNPFMTVIHGKNWGKKYLTWWWYRKQWKHEWMLCCVCVALFIASLPMAGWTACLSAVLLSRAFPENLYKAKAAGFLWGWFVCLFLKQTTTDNKKAPVIQADTHAKKFLCNTASSYA